MMGYSGSFSVDHFDQIENDQDIDRPIFCQSIFDPNNVTCSVNFPGRKFQQYSIHLKQLLTGNHKITQGIVH